jgi:uncharacterized protein (DUF111 family)
MVTFCSLLYAVAIIWHPFSSLLVFRFRDTVGTLIALHAIGVISVSASKLPLGEGMVWTDHGCLPIPAPATLRLLIDMPVCKVRSRLYVMHILTP